MIEFLLDGFQPIGATASNELDRRLLFEVTGFQLYKDEFEGNGSSDSDSDSEEQSPDIRASALIVNSDTDSGGESEDSKN